MNCDDGKKHFNRGPESLPSSHTLFSGFFVFSQSRHSERPHPPKHQDAIVAVNAGRCVKGGAVPEKRHIGVPKQHPGGNGSAELTDPELRTNGQPSQNIRRLLVNAVRKVGHSTSGDLKAVRGVDPEGGAYAGDRTRKSVEGDRCASEHNRWSMPCTFRVKAPPPKVIFFSASESGSLFVQQSEKISLNFFTQPH